MQKQVVMFGSSRKQTPWEYLRNIQIWPDSEIDMIRQTQAEGRERQVNRLLNLL